MTAAVQERPSALRSKKSIGVSFAALVAAAALAFGTAMPAQAATGGQVGEWDIVAASNGETPKLASFSHVANSWDTVSWSTAWFEVNSSTKTIPAASTGSTTVTEGGGIHFENTSGTAKTAQFRFRIPAGTGLSITNANYTVVNVSAVNYDRYVYWTTPSVQPADEFHEHFDWVFSTSASSVVIPVRVVVSGVFTAYQDYGFDF